MKVWYDDGKIMCLSEQCDQSCPRFETCADITDPDENSIRVMVMRRRLK